MVNNVWAGTRFDCGLFFRRIGRGFMTMMKILMGLGDVMSSIFLGRRRGRGFGRSRRQLRSRRVIIIALRLKHSMASLSEV